MDGQTGASDAADLEKPKTLVSFRVLVGNKVCLNWYILPVEDGPNFDWALESIRFASKNGGCFSNEISPEWNLSCVYLSREATGKNPLDVSPKVSVAEACRTFGRFVTFEFEEPATAASKQIESKNAFALLMKSAETQAKQVVQPARKPETRGDWRLFNALVNLFEREQLGFSASSRLAETSGKEFIETITSVLFQVLVPERMARLKDRCIKIPDYWLRLVEDGQVYNDPTSHKHGLRAMSHALVVEWRDVLYKALLCPWLQQQKWQRVNHATRNLATCLDKYAEYLTSSTKRVNAMHSMLEPARCPGDGSSSNLKRIESCARPEAIIRRYKDLEQVLAPQDVYGDPVFVVDYCPTDRRERYVYLQELCFPFAVEVFRYHQGGNRGTLTWIWKAPSEPGQSDNSKSCSLVNKLLEDVPVYHTRAMRREFVQRYGLISRVSPTILNEMYQFITDDSSALPTSASQAVTARLRLALELQDPDLVFDLRKLNAGRHVEYEVFYEAAQAYIERNALQACDDRRHGSTCHMALAMSVRDFRDLKPCQKAPLHRP